jgi:hypothetical protein
VYGDFFYEKAGGYENKLLPVTFGGYDPTNDLRLLEVGLDQTVTTVSSAGLL